MHKRSYEDNSAKIFFNYRVLFLLLITLLCLGFYSSVSSPKSQNVGAQTTPQLGAWQSTASFPGQGHPYPSFVHDGYYFVNSTDSRKVYSGKPGADGNITSWQQAWGDHGGVHGFTAVQTDNSAFMMRNGHISEYPFTANGMMENRDYTFYETSLSASFGGRLWVWDTAVYAPLTTGKYIFHLGGFNCPPKTCPDSYTYRGDIYFARLPMGNKFTYTGKQHPDFSPTANGGDGPGKSVFFAPNGGADYGFIYTTRNLHNSLYKIRVNSDGSLDNWERLADIPAGNGNQRGDLFVIGNTLFAIRGSKVFSTNLDPASGALAGWSDDPPDLPEAQIVSPWGNHLEGAAWGIIGNYVYVTGDTKVFYAPIQSAGGGSTPTVAAATPTTGTQPTVPPGSCPTSSSNSYESWQMDQNSAANSSEAKDHPDKNIRVRGFESSNAAKQLTDRGEPIDPKSPQLSTLLDQTPAIVSTYKVYDWNWANNTRGGLLGKYDATMIGLTANSGSVIRVPDAKFDLIAGTETYGGFTATILYADQNSLTIKYTLQDDVVSHYTIHLDNICTDPNLLSLYNQLDAQKYPNSKIRLKLPIVKGKQVIGTSKGEEVRVAVRNSGEFIDPRLKNSWWRGLSALPTGGAPTSTPGGATPTPTTTGGGVNPTPSTPATTVAPTQAACTAADLPAPKFTSPTGLSQLIAVTEGTNTISWEPISGASRYLLRVDDTTNGWVGDCSKTQNPGDICLDNLTSPTYSMNFVNGHKYGIWAAAVNSCGSAKNNSGIRVLGTTAACAFNMPAPTLIAPPSGALSAGSYTIRWSGVANATGYGLRINDTSNGWDYGGDCSEVFKQNAGDVCLDHMSTSTLSYSYDFQQGHTYGVWVAGENSCHWGGHPSGASVTVPGTTQPTLEPTRAPGSCTPAEIPSITSPLEGGANAGVVKITWSPVSTARTYALRIDDLSNPWNGSCDNPNSGDKCVNDIPKSTTSYDFNAQEGHTYHFWLHSINYCLDWSKSNDSSVTIPPPVDATSCRIQGYRTVVGPIDQNAITTRWGYYINSANPNQSLSLWVPDAIKQQPVSVAGTTAQSVYQTNPYFMIVPGNKTYTVSIPAVSGYTVSTTYCNNATNCHTNLTANGTLQQGASRTITCPGGGYADVWFNYSPSSIPTIAVSPTPGASAGPTPTPTVCTAVANIAWREGEKYTRSVIAYDGIDVIENIALHLKPILEEDAVVEVSMDNGSTWENAEKPASDDYIITLVNHNSDSYTVQVRAKNACGLTSAIVSVEVGTVPLPTLTPAASVTPSVTLAPRNPLAPAIIIGGAILLVLIAAGMMLGI